MKITKLFPTMAALAAASLIALTSYTLQAEGGKGACREDVKKHCSGVEKGKGRIRKCLKENEGQLSAGCKARMEQGMAMRKKVREACKEDHKKLCKGKRGKQGRQCMKENKDQFSASCRSAFEEAEAMRGKK